MFFEYFWALDMAPTWDDPVLLIWTFTFKQAGNGVSTAPLKSQKNFKASSILFYSTQKAQKTFETKD